MSIQVWAASTCEWCGADNVPYEVSGELRSGLKLCDPLDGVPAWLCPHCVDVFIEQQRRARAVGDVPAGA